ncbi:MAG: hypothetical protein ABI945_10390 [Nitrospirales bacterium]
MIADGLVNQLMASLRMSGTGTVISFPRFGAGEKAGRWMSGDSGIALFDQGRFVIQAGSRS